jgi:plastocyanin domain-containing protein
MLIVNVLGILLIVLIIWWFWLYKPEDAAVSSEDILVTVENGVYTPSRIKLAGNKASTLHFIRKDGSPCAATVQFPALEISEELPLDKAKAISLPALPVGEYAFHCQMQMYRGTLLVE